MLATFNIFTIRGKEGLLFIKRYEKESEKTNQIVGDCITHIQSRANIQNI